MADNNTLKHVKVSSHSDNPDTTLVNPSDWNHEHHFNNGTTGQVLKWDGTKTDNVTFGEAIDTSTTAGLPGPGRTGRLIYVTDGNKGLRVDNGSIIAPITPIINVVEYATSGSGVQIDPWMGWEVAFSIVTGGVFTSTPGYTYALCDGWFKTSATMVLKAYNTVYGVGYSTVLQYTGASIGINLNGTAGSPELTNHIQLRDFQLRSAVGTIGLSVYNTSSLKVNNVAIRGTLTDGDSITGWTTAGLSIGGNGAGFSVINFFNRLVSKELVGDAVQFASGASNYENIIFTQCNLQGVGGHCISMVTAAQCRNIAFYGCEIEGSSLSIIKATYFYNLSIYDCAFEGTSSTSLIEIGTSNPVADSNGPFNFVGNYVFNAGTGFCLSLGTVINFNGGLITGNLFVSSPGSVANIKLGLLENTNIIGNRGVGAPTSIDYSTANLTNCHIEDWNLNGTSLTRSFFRNADDLHMRLMQSRSISNDLISIYFGNIPHPILSKLSCLNIDQTVNAGGIIATVGDGAAALKDVLKLNIFGTAANDTAMMLYDVTAGTLQRVTIGIANSGGAGFRLLRIPN